MKASSTAATIRERGRELEGEDAPNGARDSKRELISALEAFAQELESIHPEQTWSESDRFRPLDDRVVERVLRALAAARRDARPDLESHETLSERDGPL